jgi:hypothetical protein
MRGFAPQLLLATLLADGPLSLTAGAEPIQGNDEEGFERMQVRSTGSMYPASRRLVSNSIPFMPGR